MKSHMLPEPENQAYEPETRSSLPRTDRAKSTLPEKPRQNRLSSLWEDDCPANDMPIRTFLRIVLAH